MNNFLAGVLMVLLSFVAAAAQATSQTDKEKEAERQQQDRHDRRIDNLRNIDKTSLPIDPNEKFRIYQSMIKPLYRQPTDEEMQMLAPERQDQERYADFLKNKKTGLVKLIADKECSSGAKVVSSSEHCIKYKMPGAGAVYSFRIGNYHHKDLGDLNFADGSFKTPGLLKQGILIALGDVPLKEVKLGSDDLKTLVEFQPTDDFTKAGQFATLLEKGIQGEKFVYKSDAPVMENTTYALRSIAYRGEVMRSIESVDYNLFEFDDRRDVIIAFRVVRYVPGESVTIVWKELSSNRSLKMNIDN